MLKRVINILLMEDNEVDVMDVKEAFNEIKIINWFLKSSLKIF